MSKPIAQYAARSELGTPMRRVWHLVWCLVAATALAACTTRVNAPARATPDAAAAIGAWARVLERFVADTGEVDFNALAQDRADLDEYVRYVADTPPGGIPDGNARLAHMVNAYNALAMFNVLASDIPVTHAGWNKLRFFVLRKLEVGGQSMSLYGFENDVIRPYARARNDPRIHFALNCMAVSCPVLPRKPFSALGLDAELERETRGFFARSQNYRIDVASRTVWLSEILAFYPEDFVPLAADSLAAYAARYAPRAAPADFAQRFTPYDWTVANSSRSR